ncbi:MAG: hypothetical protein OXF45_03615, partial [Candidatus Dadabacteria bacterium]|nr:hypothetical protein [Candidatus Dadabacteria bacterium]
LADASVTTAKIADLNVTTEKLADGSVTSAKIADRTIALADLSEDVKAAFSNAAELSSGELASVQTLGTRPAGDTSGTVWGYLQTGGLPGGFLADSSITTGKLADASVTSAKIADNTIALADLSPEAITGLQGSAPETSLTTAQVEALSSLGTKPDGQSGTVWDAIESLQRSGVFRTETDGSESAPVQVGAGAVAVGPGDLAIGRGAVVGADHSTAIGDNAFVNGSESVAIGERARACSTETMMNIAGCSAAVAVGQNAVAVNVQAIALGQNSSASGARAMAIGQGASAEYENSIAIGQGVSTTEANQVVVGNERQKIVFAPLANASAPDNRIMSVNPDGSVGAADSLTVERVESGLSALEQGLKDIRKLRKGMAVSSALSSLNLLSQKDKRFAVSAGVGFADSETAFATGFGVKLLEQKGIVIFATGQFGFSGFGSEDSKQGGGSLNFNF